VVLYYKVSAVRREVPLSASAHGVGKGSSRLLAVLARTAMNANSYSGKLASPLSGADWLVQRLHQATRSCAANSCDQRWTRISAGAIVQRLRAVMHVGCWYRTPAAPFVPGRVET
jgi:hypothetical protein